MDTTSNSPSGCFVSLKIGMLMGIAGGAAEVLWIVLFSRLAGGSANDVAIGITTTFAPGFTAQPVATLFGLAVHFMLASGLGLAVAVLVRHVAPKLAGSFKEAGFVVAALAVVWALNFLVILPVVNPDFVYIVPMPVSLASKLLFGIAAAFVLRITTNVQPNPAKNPMEERI